MELAKPRAHCVPTFCPTTSKLLYFSELQSPTGSSSDDDSSYFTGLLRGLKGQNRVRKAISTVPGTQGVPITADTVSRGVFLVQSALLVLSPSALGDSGKANPCACPVNSIPPCLFSSSQASLEFPPAFYPFRQAHSHQGPPSQSWFIPRSRNQHGPPLRAAPALRHW